MTSVHVSPLVFVQLLADPQKHLAALLWSATPSEATGLESWLADPDFAALGREVPCLWRAPEVAHWSTEAQTALGSSGAAPLDPARLAQCDTTFALTPPQTWVAGPWYLQAPARPSSAQAASRSLALQLLQLVNSDADTRALEDVFRRDATLSYQLLRLVNSPAMRRSREITSFGQAILLLGRQQLQRWINLLLFAARDDDDRGSLLLAHVSLRARGMELLAQASGLDRATQEQAFMTGMFSLLGVLFGSPLPALLQPLQLSADMSAALLQGEGELGALLHAWQAMETANTAALQQALAQRGVSAADFNRLLLQACHWMLGLTRGGTSS